MKITDFLARFTEVVSEGDGWVVTCPSHPDSQPSLRVAIGRNGAVLLKCRAGCQTTEVLRALDLDFADLRDVEADGAPVARSEATPASDTEVTKLAVQLAAWAEALELQWTDDSQPIDPAANYLVDRFGLGHEDAVRLRLGVTDELGGGPRLVVPFLDDRGVARGYQARALSPNVTVRWRGAKSPAGASWSRLAFLPAAESYDQIVVTEGPSDGLTAVGAGYDTIVVRGAGLVSDPQLIDQIATWAGSRQVVVAGDSDRAGTGFARVLVSGLRDRGVKAAALEVPAADVNDWRQADPDSFTLAFQGAVKALTFTRASKSAAADWEPDDLTDLGAARRYRDYLQRSSSDVRYTVEAGFYLLDRGVWLQDSLNHVRTVAHEVSVEVWAEVIELQAQINADREAEREISKAVVLAERRAVRFAKHISAQGGIDAALNELRALPGVAISINDLDQHHHLLAVANGTVDLRTGKLSPTDPAHLISRRLEVAYRPDATAPRWLEFLREVFPNHPDEMPEFLRRLIGYGITGLTDEQCFAVLWGTGANGKSVLTEVLTRVFRTITTTTPFSTFEVKPGGNSGVPNDIAALKGARLVFASEGEAGKPMAEAMLKRVTGRDMISARFMRQEYFEFLPTFLLMLATNYKPKFRGQDEGLWRRVKLIPFERFFQPDERDPKLHLKLMDEAEGILAWAVSGAVDWFKDQSLREPSLLQELTTSYKFDSDALAGFLPGTYVIDELATGFLARKELWDSYQAWCEEEQFGREMRWTQRAFYAALEERGARRVKSGGAHGFKGLRRATEEELDAMMAAPVDLDEAVVNIPEPELGEPAKMSLAPDLDDL